MSLLRHNDLGLGSLGEGTAKKGIGICTGTFEL